MPEILRVINFPITITDFVRRVHKHGHRRNALCHRRRINHRLEHRARLAHRVGHAIKLADRIIATADHRENFACVRVEGNKSRFGFGGAFLEYLIELIEMGCDHSIGGFLQIQIERGLNAQMGRRVFIKFSLIEFAFDVVDKVRRGETTLKEINKVTFIEG